MKKLMVLMFAALLLICTPVYADEPVDADINVRANEKITVEIIPMGQSSGTRRVIDREGKISLSFARSGEYSYRIRQVGKEGNGVDLSVYHVRVTVIEEENGLVPAVSVYKAGELAKQAEITFHNENDPAPTEVPQDPTPVPVTPVPVTPEVRVTPHVSGGTDVKTVTQTPKTGDENEMWIYGVMAAAAAGCVAAAAVKRRRDGR